MTIGLLKMGARKSLSMDEVTRILKMRRLRKSIPEIAQELNRSHNAVARVLKDPLNYRSKRPVIDGMTAEQIWEYSELMANTKGVEKIKAKRGRKKRDDSVVCDTDGIQKTQPLQRRDEEVEDETERDNLLFFRFPKVNRRNRKAVSR